MKFFTLILWASCQMCFSQDEKLSLNMSYGKADHYVCNLNKWEDKEVVLSRLKKNDKVYEYIWASKERFLIRESVSNETYFIFEKNFSVTMALYFLNRAYLADIWLEENSISVLMTDGNSYGYMRSMKKLPPAQDGTIYIPDQHSKGLEWKSFIVMPKLETVYLDSTIIENVRLSKIDQIDFTAKKLNENVSREDKLNIEFNKLVLNGTPVNYKGGWVREPQKEAELLDFIINFGGNNQELRESVEIIENGKDGLIALLNRFKDQANVLKAITRIEKAFEEKEKKPQ